MVFLLMVGAMTPSGADAIPPPPDEERFLSMEQDYAADASPSDFASVPSIRLSSGDTLRLYGILREADGTYVEPCTTLTWEEGPIVAIRHGDMHKGEVILVPKTQGDTAEVVELVFTDSLSSAADSVLCRVRGAADSIEERVFVVDATRDAGGIYAIPAGPNRTRHGSVYSCLGRKLSCCSSSEKRSFRSAAGAILMHTRGSDRSHGIREIVVLEHCRE